MARVTAQGQAAPAAVSRARRVRVSDITSPRTVLITCVTLLTVLGVIMVFSATSVELSEAGKDPYGEVISQLKYIAISLVFALVVTRVPYRLLLSGLIYVLLAGVVVLQLAVLVMGTDSHGATRWIYVAGFSVQPSEFAKIVVAMFAAKVFGEYFEGRITLGRFLLMLVLGVLVPLGLVTLQKDLGTIIIVGVTLYCMLVLAGCSPRALAVLAVVMVGLVALMIVLASYRSSRFTVWLTDPFQSTDWYYNQGWQSAHGLYAFASGGFFGVGIGNSRQKYSYLPEAENDFIFAILGEELGLLGTLFVVALFCLLGWAGWRIARDAPDIEGRLLAGGITSCILVQALVNMCGVLRILPLTGRPLPFMSSGGTSMLTSLIMVGLILSVAGVTRREQTQAPRRDFRVIEGGRGSGEPDGRPGRAGRPGSDGPAGRGGARASRPRGGARRDTSTERGTQ